MVEPKTVRVISPLNFTTEATSDAGSARFWQDSAPAKASAGRERENVVPRASEPLFEVGFGVSEVGFHVSEVGFHDSGVGFHDSEVGFHDSEVGFHVSEVGFGVSEVGFGVSEVGFRVSGVGFGKSGVGDRYHRGR